jgi:uncharacterized membrane protein
MWTKHSPWKFCFVILLLFGIFFRFYHLDHKTYWHDETYTSLRISGYTASEVSEKIYNNKIISVAALQHYLHPNSDKSFKDAMNAFGLIPRLDIQETSGLNDNVENFNSDF